MTVSVQVFRHFLSLRLGPWSIITQRETTPASKFISQPAPGEVIIDLPGWSIAFENEARNRKRLVSQTSP
ncbi:MAG: hypothetical protein ACK4VZ_11550 [Paracoccaceae bacterium]